MPKRKVKFNYWFLAGLYIMFTSCSNEFQLTEGSVELPIVYGALQAADTATYIRVERAFVDEATSAFILAKDPSQLYFEGITVKLKHTKTGGEYTMTRVDGNNEGYQRDAGAFADAPNYLYKIKKSELNLIENDQYELLISKEDGTILSSATTTILSSYGNGDVSSPAASALLSFLNNSDFRVRWFPDEDATIHDVKLVFYFREEKNGVSSDQSATWTLAKNYITTPAKSEYLVKGSAFYQFMQGAIPEDLQVKRYFDRASLIIVSGTNDIEKYISIGQANLGITSSGEIPVYSNLNNGGLGIFASTSTFIRNDIALAKTTLDSLRLGVFTKKLNFQ